MRRSYFADYSNYNGNLVGLVVDARAIGLVDGESDFAYSVEACTGTFSGDVPGLLCDSAGVDRRRHRHVGPRVSTSPTRPCEIDPLVCKGFWDGGDCDGADPINVTSAPRTRATTRRSWRCSRTMRRTARPTVVETTT